MEVAQGIAEIKLKTVESEWFLSPNFNTWKYFFLLWFSNCFLDINASPK